MIDRMINQVAQQVGELVLDALKEAGRTKVWLSEQTGIPYPTLNRKVAGKSEFHFSELLLVAEALGVSPAAFTPDVFNPARQAVAS